MKKVSERTAPKGAMEQTYLVSGKHLAMRLWKNEAPQTDRPRSRDYETVGYVLSGKAELTAEGQSITLAPGDSWLVPAHAEHAYRLIGPFTPVEATGPPAPIHGRDEDAS